MGTLLSPKFLFCLRHNENLRKKRFFLILFERNLMLRHFCFWLYLDSLWHKVGERRLNSEWSPPAATVWPQSSEWLQTGGAKENRHLSVQILALKGSMFPFAFRNVAFGRICVCALESSAFSSQSPLPMLTYSDIIFLIYIFSWNIYIYISYFIALILF